MYLNKLSFLVMSITLLGFIAGSLDARGGGGGGGRGAGGSRGGAGGAASRGGTMYSGGQTMNRTPTMTRAAPINRPQMQQVRPQIQQVSPQLQQARQQIQQVQQARPQMQQVRPQIQQARPQIQEIKPQIQAGPQVQQVRPQIQQARINQNQSLNRDQLRNQVSQQSQDVKSKLDQNVLSQRQVLFSNQHLSQISNDNQFSLNTSQRLRSVRPNYNQWFDQNFFQKHNLNPLYARTNVNWWRAANWGAVSGWGAWNWGTPYYYDDEGYSLSVTAPQDGYTQGYNNSNDTVGVAGDWLPLGVFAMGRNTSEASMSNRILQLALNRNGEIAGVVYNTSSDSVQNVVGGVDVNSQQAFWSLADKADSPIVTTGLYNLTEAQTPIIVMFSDGSKQKWVLVRLQN